MENPFEEIQSRLTDIEKILSLITSSLPDFNREKEIDTIGAEEAAKILNITVKTVYSKTHKKTIPHSKRGKLLLFSRKKLAEYILDGNVPTIDKQISDAESYRVKKLLSKKIA